MRSPEGFRDYAGQVKLPGMNQLTLFFISTDYDLIPINPTEGRFQFDQKVGIASCFFESPPGQPIKLIKSSLLPPEEGDYITIFETFDGKTFKEVWKSPTMTGYVAAIAYTDLNGDGNRELIVIENEDNSSRVVIYASH